MLSAIDNGSIKHLLVDLDDTLLFTSRYNTEVYCQAIQRITGINLHSIITPNSRLTRVDIHRIFGQSAIADKIEDIIKEKKSLYCDTDKAHEAISFNESIKKILDYYKGKLPIILLTNANRARAEYLYNIFELDAYTERIYSNPQENTNKYEWIKTKVLDLEPQHTLVLENEEQQAKQALLAGFAPHNIIVV